MKPARLLSSLVLTAATGAGVFLVFIAPTRDSREEAAGLVRAERKRALAVAARAKAAPGRVAEEAPLAPAKKRARERTAQRDFLLNAEFWPREKWQTVEEIVDLYSGAWNALPDSLVYYKRKDASRILTAALAEIRDRFDLLRADVTQLTPGAGERWEQWEAIHWEGYVPGGKDQLPPDSGGAKPDVKRNGGNFRDTQIARVDAVIEALEYQGDAAISAALGRPATPPVLALPVTQVTGPGQPRRQEVEMINWEDLRARIPEPGEPGSGE